VINVTAKIITFGNFKGGTGKTTNATLIGYTLADQGYKTLLIDMDPQGNATNLYLKTRNIAANESKNDFGQTLMTGIQQQDLQSTVISITNHLDLIPSAADFALFPRYMEQETNYDRRVAYLDTLLDPLKAQYDYIIVDIPPTISLITDSALFMSDYCVIVLQTHERSLQGAEAFIRYIQEEVINNFQAPRLEVLGILAVLLKNGAPVDMATLENAKTIFGSTNVFQTTINSMERLKRYDITGITELDMHDKKVSALYETVTNELLERIEGFENE